MSDTVHYIPGPPMIRYEEVRIRAIPCGIGKRKWRDLCATTKRKDVTCERCLAFMRNEFPKNSNMEKP